MIKFIHVNIILCTYLNQHFYFSQLNIYVNFLILLEIEPQCDGGFNWSYIQRHMYTYLWYEICVFYFLYKIISKYRIAVNIVIGQRYNTHSYFPYFFRHDIYPVAHFSHACCCSICLFVSLCLYFFVGGGVGGRGVF